MTREYERSLAASAELLHERIRNGHATVDGPIDEAEAKHLDDSVVEDFEVHLDAQLDDVEKYARFDSWPEDEDLPEWVSVFSDMLQRLPDSDDVNSDFSDEIAFADVFQWVVDYSRECLLDADTTPLTPAAMRDFEEYLLDRLVVIGGKALYVDFRSYITEYDPTVVEEGRLSADSTRWYTEYVSAFFDGRAIDFFDEFPVLARLITIVSRQWGTMVNSFITRVDDDYDRLCSLSGVEDLGRVTHVSPAGDSHEGGQSVLLVTFESGDELVYKPRDLKPEKQLFEFESWLCRRFDDFPELQTPELLSEPTYGWVEVVSSATFSSVDALGDYYRRAGALLCVLYVLNASDCHFENIIAGETSPVLVDAETLLDTPNRGTSWPKLDTKLQRHVAQSTLLTTVMLPFKFGDKEVTRSGLAMVEEQEGRIQSSSWVDVNTDAMKIEYEKPNVTPENNYPTYGGEPAPPELFVADIVDGFETAYECIQNARETVRRRVTELFDSLRIRTILAGSVVYDALLRALMNPEYLRSGVSHDCKIQKTLSRRLDTSPLDIRDDGLDDILRAERASIFERDVPKFMMRTDTDGIYFDGEQVVDTDVHESGIERIRNQVMEMSDRDKVHQRGLIRACLGDSATVRSRGHGEVR